MWILASVPDKRVRPHDQSVRHILQHRSHLLIFNSLSVIINVEIPVDVSYNDE